MIILKRQKINNYSLIFFVQGIFDYASKTYIKFNSAIWIGIKNKNGRSKNQKFQFFEDNEEFFECWYSCSQSNFAFLTVFFQIKKKNSKQVISR
jgi:hypothetical protein